jgi:beta-glucosidase
MSERERGRESAEGRFPEGFLWGAATSAYQIEGSPLADGAGAGIWHLFSHAPGRTANGDTGDVACDHYRRFPEDIALMRRLGLRAYRFSLAWGRILPQGRGRVNQAGLDFYSRLIDSLLEAGIKPCVTLYHWDLPAALDELGGWLNPGIAGWFAEYASVAFRTWSDRVDFWMTLNEPWVVADAGYLHGVHAPGHRSLREAPLAAHNLLCAHGDAVGVFREGYARGGRIGLVVNLEPKEAATQSPGDLAAAERAHQYMNRQYLDPIFLGRYPEAMAEIFGQAWPEFPPADFERIRRPVDFLGVNYYTRGIMRHDESVRPLCASYVRRPEALYTDLGWEVHPESLTRILRWVKDTYGEIPIYVTENGAAFPDPPAAAAEPVSDPFRVEYYRGHLRAARAAIAQGVDLRGYFAWSLLDNFEWSAGYSKRFGLVHVHYPTQTRTVKASGILYRDIIASNGGSLGS